MLKKAPLRTHLLANFAQFGNKIHCEKWNQQAKELFILSEAQLHTLKKNFTCDRIDFPCRQALRYAILLIFLCLWPTITPAEMSEQQLHIQQRLEQLHFGSQEKIGQDTIYAAGLLLDLYRAHQFQLLWTQQDSIDQLVTAIQGSAKEGLIPDDYHLQAITFYSKTLSSNPSISRQAEFDLLLSDAMMLLGHHKRYGKVDPMLVEDRLNLAVPNPQPPLASLYLNAIKTGTVQNVLEKLSPDHQVYTNLQDALVRYKKIAGKSGWPIVPPGPSLKPGMRDERITALRKRLIASGDLGQMGPDPAFFNDTLLRAVKAFQTHHYLEADGVVGKTTLQEMNRSVAERISQIRVNLERIRWILHDLPSSSIIVDIAGFMLRYYQKGEVAWSSKVMVGQPFHQTPVFRSAITYLVLNPTWTIPPDIAKNETVPEIVKDRNYLNKQNLRIFTSAEEEVNPATIPWKQYLGRTFPYTLRQDAGPEGALGLIKFIFPNSYHVYLHDTPSKTLFDKTSRAFSHGCIRVQNPLDLGKLLIANDPGNQVTPTKFDQILASGKPTTLFLKTPLPVFLIYWTTSIHNNEVWFKPDLYDRDRGVLSALDALPSLLKTTVQIPEAKVGQPPATTVQTGRQGIVLDERPATKKIL